MHDGRLVKQRLVLLPVRHVLVHQFKESVRVCWFQQMHQFVNQYVFQAIRVFLPELKVQPNPL